MKIKRIAALVLVMLMAFSLIACGSGGNGGSSSGDPNTLTINIWDANQQEGLQKIADKWSETSGIAAKIEVVDWDNYWTLLEAGASGGEMPDVFWMHSNTAQMYMENDILLDLTDYVANDDAINMDNYYEGVAKLYTKIGRAHV